MFWKLFKRKSPPKKTWVGNVVAYWITPQDEQYEFFYHLYIYDDGRRTYDVSGVGSKVDDYKLHRRYSRIVKPFIDGCSMDFLVGRLTVYNKLYWNELGYAVSDIEEPLRPHKKKEEKPKPEFKLLEFKKDENPEDIGA